MVMVHSSVSIQMPLSSTLNNGYSGHVRYMLLPRKGNRRGIAGESKDTSSEVFVKRGS